MESTKQAIFLLEGREYGLDIMEVNIIEKYMNIEPVADFPHNLKGIIRLRGDIIPVYSLRRKFGLEDIEPNEETRLVITVSNGIRTAYEVDRMSEILQFENDQIYEVPSIVENEDTSYIKLIASVEDRLVILLDNNGILSREEQEKMKAAI